MCLPNRLYRLRRERDDNSMHVMRPFVFSAEQLDMTCLGYVSNPSGYDDFDRCVVLPIEICIAP